jgi:dTDP-glucose pyrophosphorylase
MNHNEIGLNIVILGNRQSEAAGNNDLYPAYLAERNSISVIQRIINSCEQIDNAKIIFSVLEADAKQFNLIDVLKQLSSGANLRITPDLTKGSACTALLAACELVQDHELLILSANEIVDIDLVKLLENFRSLKFDAATVVFHSIHPRYSYVQIDDQNYISEIAQRDPISNTATTGLFWFKKTSDFVDAAKNMIIFRSPVKDNYYVGLTLNELILGGKKVGFQRISEDMYIPLKDQIQSTFYQIGVLNGEI